MPKSWDILVVSLRNFLMTLWLDVRYGKIRMSRSISTFDPVLVDKCSTPKLAQFSNSKRYFFTLGTFPFSDNSGSPTLLLALVWSLFDFVQLMIAGLFSLSSRPLEVSMSPSCKHSSKKTSSKFGISYLKCKWIFEGYRGQKKISDRDSHFNFRSSCFIMR